MWKTQCRHRQAGVGVHAVVPTLFASRHSALGLSASPREEEGSRTRWEPGRDPARRRPRPGRRRWPSVQDRVCREPEGAP